MLSNIYNALHDGGFLMFFEMTTVLPTLLWGLDAQCWNFEDEREFGLWVNRERWERLLEEVGFSKVCALGELNTSYSPPGNASELLPVLPAHGCPSGMVL